MGLLLNPSNRKVHRSGNTFSAEDVSLITSDSMSPENPSTSETALDPNGREKNDMQMSS
jgi:hypothetical protein